MTVVVKYMNPMNLKSGNEWIRNQIGKIDSRTPNVFAAGKIGANESILCSSEQVTSDIQQSCASLAGIYPISEQDRFKERFCDAVSKMDLLCPWNINNGRGEEKILDRYASESCEYAELKTLDPLEIPSNESRWSHALEGFRVLVISPFKQTILHQYQNREWDQTGILPELASLTVQRADYCKAVCHNGFDSWEEHLNRHLDEIDPEDYDIALIGCGGISLILAAELKDRGLSAIHTGGSTQLLFGVVGGRWENRQSHTPHINKHWTRPFVEDQPDFPDVMEKYDGGACYF
jgi:hypothetical protein